MLRLVFIVRSLEFGGAERQLIELLKGIDKRRFEVFVLCFYPGGRLWDEAKSIADIRLSHLGKTGRWDIAALAALWKYMRNVNPDIVHGYMDVANVLALVAKLLGAKVVWGVRGSKAQLSHYDFGRRIARWAEISSSRFADLVICNSNAAYRDLELSGYPVDRMTVIANGIDTRRFRINPTSRQAVRAEWEVGQEEFLVGLVARFDPMKGQRVFMAAASRVLARHADVKFVIVGDGPERQRQSLRELVSEMQLTGRLIWAGYRADVPEVLSALDLSVSASLFGEGFSNALGESMACGVPCVATRVGDSARILGNLGWLVEPGDEVELAEKIAEAIRFCRGPEFSPGLVRARIEREFSVERLVADTTAALSSLGGLDRMAQRRDAGRDKYANGGRQ